MSAPVTTVDVGAEIYRRTKIVQRVDLFAAGVALVALVLFSILTALVIAGRTASIDHDLILSLRASASPFLTAALLVVTFTSGKLAIPSAILFALLISRRDGWRSGWYYVAACASAQLLNAVLKLEIHRARPHGISPKLTAAGGLAYPSADAMLAVVIFGLGTLVLSRTITSARSRAAVRGLALIFVVAAAIARVYLGAHWPSDVLGGLLAGVACAAFWVAMRMPFGLLNALTAFAGARLNTRSSYTPTRYLWSRGLALLCDHNGGFDFIRKQRGGGRAPLPYDLDDYSNVRDGDLVWVRVDSLPLFLEQVLPTIEARFALITGDEDLAVPSEIEGAGDLLAHHNLICWFAQNFDDTDTSEKIFPIPIGVDFHTIANGRKWGHWQATPRQQEAELEGLRATMPANADRLVRVHADFHFNIGHFVHPTDSRQVAYSVLRDNPNVDFQGRKLSRSQLWREKTRYAFVVSPRGHGMDCHRTWESLLLGSIPIVKRSPLDSLYDGLPVVIVNEWNEITAQSLNEWHAEYCDFFERAEVQERLTNAYWIALARRTLADRMTRS